MLPTQLLRRSPPIDWVAVTAKKNIVNKNNMKTSSITGSESIIVFTSLAIPGIFFTTFNGLKILKIFAYCIP